MVRSRLSRLIIVAMFFFLPVSDASAGEGGGKAAPGTASVSRPTTAPTTAPTAAELCWEAFELLAGLDEEDGQRLGTCGKDGCWVVNTPLDEKTADLLARQERAVALARRAAAMPPDEWDFGAGDQAKLVELANQGPRLSALVVLQARHDLASGEFERCVDDLLAAMALARHFGSAPNFMSKVVETAAWRPAGEALAVDLPKLPRELVAALPQRLDRLPKSATPAEVLRGEFQYAKRQAPAQLGRANAWMVGAMEGFYEALAEGAELPPAKFKTLVDEQVKRFAANPWAANLGPVVKPMREPTALQETREAMLRAGMEIVLNGEPAPSTRDPFGDGPFSLRKAPGGFELISALTVRGEPVTMRFGRE